MRCDGGDLPYCVQFGTSILWVGRLVVVLQSVDLLQRHHETLCFELLVIQVWCRDVWCKTRCSVWVLPNNKIFFFQFSTCVAYRLRLRTQRPVRGVSCSCCFFSCWQSLAVRRTRNTPPFSRPLRGASCSVFEGSRDMDISGLLTLRVRITLFQYSNSTFITIEFNYRQGWHSKTPSKAILSW